MRWLEGIIKELVTKHPKEEGFNASYGTAGFRMKATHLPYITYTIGILASLRSKFLGGKAVGVMVTASHNPPDDNGVKVVDPMGSMLESSWEAYATTLANSRQEALASNIEKMCDELQINIEQEAHVVLCRDSRASSERLSAAVVDGAKCIISTRVQDFGLSTTPQLHYYTRTLNDAAYGPPTEHGYYDKMASAFKNMCDSAGNAKKINIIVDAANGVGAPKLEHLFLKYLAKYLDYKVVNRAYDKPELLNFDCGADYVKTNQKLPKNILDEAKGQLCASMDGDADRLICYYLDNEGVFNMLDGDKMSSLIAWFLQKILEKIDPKKFKLRIGVVQTAYANGASTAYIENKLKVPVACTPTGVKYLHHAAEDFDIGIYFEANGHGTVLFSENARHSIFNYDPKNASSDEIQAVELLQLFSQLINQTVGDAISDLLVILVILFHMQLDPEKWQLSYKDLPNRLVKVVVPDRTVYKTVNAERQLISPKGMQDQINAIIAQFSNGRSFVRASGTEDAVRVYAEADTKEEAFELSELVAKVVKSNK